ncbi:hypothetical protein Vadar_002261 [Vaccinium darrowii]|uniref:Uncharacterized protein n=1 Tax=Vaccinium darrowii TaxID=229202 RepID=A0ACB7Y480_9ERIC|nr:hypothetical protein Vadar_002261 [Vaccinium darrowii]
MPKSPAPVPTLYSRERPNLSLKFQNSTDLTQKQTGRAERWMYGGGVGGRGRRRWREKMVEGRSRRWRSGNATPLFSEHYSFDSSNDFQLTVLGLWEMAMTGRLRSTLPLFHRILKSNSFSTMQRSTVQRSLLCLSFADPQFSKNYATASPPKEQKVKVPLTMYGVSGNYASALYIAAVKVNALDKVESELLDLVEASKKSTKFSLFMKDVSVPADTRIKAISEICAEAKFSELTRNFLVPPPLPPLATISYHIHPYNGDWLPPPASAASHHQQPMIRGFVLAENGRLKHLESIAKRFTELTMAHRGEMKALVTTVIPLPSEEERELKETLQGIIGQGKKVSLEQKIDPSILGGLVVEFGQKVFDMSIKNRAKQMERFLREPVGIGNL